MTSEPEAAPAPAPDNAPKSALAPAPVAEKKPKPIPAPAHKTENQPESDATPSAVPGEVETLDDPDKDRVHPVMKSLGTVIYWTSVVAALAIAALGLLILAAVEDNGFALVFLIAAAAVYGIGRFGLFFVARD